MSFKVIEEGVSEIRAHVNILMNLENSLLQKLASIERLMERESHDTGMNLYNLPDIILFLIMKYLKKKDIVSLMLCHKNFQPVGRSILLRTIVVVDERMYFKSHLRPLESFTFTTSSNFFKLLSQPHYDPKLTKRLIFFGPVACMDRALCFQKEQDQVEVYFQNPKKYALIKLDDKPGSVFELRNNLIASDYKFIEYIRIPRYGVRFLGPDKCICKSIELDTCSSHELRHFDLLKVKSLRIQRNEYWDFVQRSRQEFSLLKKLGIIDEKRDICNFALGIDKNSLQQVELLSSPDDICILIKKVLQHHKSSLVTIIHSKPGVNKSGVPFIFRTINLIEFPKLERLIYDEGIFYVERGGAKPSLFYLPY